MIIKKCEYTECARNFYGNCYCKQRVNGKCTCSAPLAKATKENRATWRRVLIKEEIEVQRSYRMIERMDYRCPRCGWQQRKYSNFCPDCGLNLMEE